MNIILDINRFTLGNTYFLDTKRNIIMDGNFTKITYSNEWFTMNGIYLMFPIEISTIEKNMNKMIMRYNAYLPSNLSIIQDFAKIEYRMLEYYKQINNCTRKVSNILAKQLYSGSMKIYKVFNYEQYPNKICNNNIPDKSSQYIMKISGIWETTEEVGITYKLIHANENYM